MGTPNPPIYPSFLLSQCPNVPMSRYSGVPVYQCPSVKVSQCQGVPVSRCPSVLVFQCPSVPASWCLSVPLHNSTVISDPRTAKFYIWRQFWWKFTFWLITKILLWDRRTHTEVYIEVVPKSLQKPKIAGKHIKKVSISSICHFRLRGAWNIQMS